jgi:predicted kinase
MTCEIVHAVWDQARILLREKTPFIWNATHLTPSIRKKALDLLWNYNADIHVTYIECSNEQQWRQRNSKRNDKALPDKALDQLLLRWDPPRNNEAENVSYYIDNKDVTNSFNLLRKISQTGKSDINLEL